MSNTPIPPEGCTCASFWTVRGTHKKDCPLAPHPTDPWIDPVTIHFKENSIPSLRRGRLTDESITALKALALREALEIIGDIPPESERWRYGGGAAGDIHARAELQVKFKDHYGGGDASRRKF